MQIEEDMLKPEEEAEIGPNRTLGPTSLQIGPWTWETL